MPNNSVAKERGILFSAPMVRANRAGVKTQTRRIMKPQPLETGSNGGVITGINPSSLGYGWDANYFGDNPRYIGKCPYGVAGDRLWVRECFLLDERNTKGKTPQEVIYDATPEWAMNHAGKIERVRFIDGGLVPPEEARRSLDANKFWHKKPSIHMPRWASRDTLEIVSVRPERLQDITELDAVAEGVDKSRCGQSGYSMEPMYSYRTGFVRTWHEINGPDSWAKNPWVWRIEYRRLTPSAA